MLDFLAEIPVAVVAALRADTNALEIALLLLAALCVRRGWRPLPEWSTRLENCGLRIARCKWKSNISLRPGETGP